MQEVVQELDKTIKIFRTYPKTNTISINAIDKLVGVFSEFLSDRQSLELFVERHEIQWQGIAVYSETDQRRSLAIKLDRDGVRRLVFLPGIDREEVLGLLEALTTEIDEESLEDDLVTLLWDKQLQHVKVYVLDDMSSDDDAFQQELVDADAIPDGAPEDGASAGSTSSPSPSLAVVAEAFGSPEAQLALCAAAKAKLHPVTEEQAHELKERSIQEETADVSKDLTEILFDVLYAETQEATQANALKVLLELTMMYVKNTDFDHAADVLTQLRATAANDDVDHHVRASVVEALQSLADPRRIEIVVDILRADPDVNQRDLARFLAALPAPAAAGLCPLMAVPRYENTARTAISHLVKEDPTVLTTRLAEPNVEMATKILTILEQVAGPEVTPALVDPLTAAEVPVKQASVKLLAKLKTAPARDLLLTYVDGDAPGLRRAALNALATFETGGGPATALRQQVMTKDFDERSLQEKKSLLVTLAKLEGPHVVDFLVDILGQTKWFEKEKHAETRACAALALGEVQVDAARSILEQHASDKSETVRTATRLALGTFESTTTAVGS